MISYNILKYPGSKWNSADWIISHFPMSYERMHYIEPFFGSGAVFFKKNRSQMETVNDMDDNVVNLFRVARDKPGELARAVELTPWSRVEYRLSYEPCDGDDVEKARRFLVRMWQGIGSKSSDITGWRKNIKGTNGNVQRFATGLPDAVLAVAQRLRHTNGSHIVQIEHMDAFELLDKHNNPYTLAYIDPPYVRSTRSGRIYKHEFRNDDHIRLLEILRAFKGKVILSGYPCRLYDDVLDGWHYNTAVAQTESARTKTEALWCNFTPCVQQKICEEMHPCGQAN